MNENGEPWSHFAWDQLMFYYTWKTQQPTDPGTERLHVSPLKYHLHGYKKQVIVYP